MKAQVHWHLRKKLFCVTSREVKTYGLVVARKESVVVGLPKFIVRKYGRDKTRQTKQKNVHAFIRGNIEYDTFFNLGRGRLIMYDPYKYDTFVMADTKEPLHEGTLVQCRIINNHPVMELY